MIGRKALSVSHALACVCVLQVLLISLSRADTLILPVVSAASIDGSPTAASFSLKVESGTSAAQLSSQQVLDISISIKPDSANLGRNGSIFAIFVKNGSFFLLRPDRAFSSWNGEIETLLPFRQDVYLTEITGVHMLSGRLSDPGQYQIFTAYRADGEVALKFTPEPFLLVVAASGTSPELEEASRIYQATLEAGVVQSRCVVCHVDGGLARNATLKFQRNSAGSAQNNLNALISYLALSGKSADTLLTKATGGSAHPGGQQLAKGSNEYAAFEQVLKLLEADKALKGQSISYNFAPRDAVKPGGVAQSLLATVELEPREATLRRATILFAGRAPSPAELTAVRAGDDNTLRSALRALMSGPQFRNFVVNATNERLLTRGADGPINQGFGNFPQLRNLFYETELSFTQGSSKINYHGVYGGRLDRATKRASGELVAHVVMNEKPYSEILTADYMMMNPLLNQVLGGSASFPATAGDTDFLPSKIGQYYFWGELTFSEPHPVIGSKILSTGKPVADYPHAGLLTDFAFLARYPTTATNRNRARARWTLYHFLGIDIEKSSQRPQDEAALSDRNNPTMNNRNCTVCHAVLDPVAGAFQNWSEWNMYRERGGDTLDGFYKYPTDGSKSLYQPGDMWYRDMRPPGLFETALSSRDDTLSELANLIVKEPGFLKAAVRFWWPAMFGESLIAAPSVESDRDFAEKSAAYAAQQASLETFARVLGQRLNAKDMLVEMMLSPWFTAQATTRHEFRAVQLAANLGAPRLLGPQQLEDKIKGLTGINRTHSQPSGSSYSHYENNSVQFGGIDSIAVLERATVLTPTILSAQQASIVEVACPAVVKDFAMPSAARRLFSMVDETVTPLSLVSQTFNVTSKSRTEWQDVKVRTRIPANGAIINVAFANPYCDYDGVRCLEQRVLYLQGLTVRHGSGAEQRFAMNSPGISVKGENCYNNGSEGTFYEECTLSLALGLNTTQDIEITARLAARQAPSREEPVRALIEVLSTEDILSATTPNALLIKRQIVELIQKLHGNTLAIDSAEVQQVYSLFAVALEYARRSGRNKIDVCHWYHDSSFLSELLTPEQHKLVRRPSLEGDWWWDDWRYLGPIMTPIMTDTTGAKRGWIAVIAYLMTHYDFLHE
jgi:hypothetical protein